MTVDEIFTGPGWHDYYNTRVTPSWIENQTEGAYVSYYNSSVQGVVELTIFRTVSDCQIAFNWILQDNSNAKMISIGHNVSLHIWNNGGSDCYGVFMSGTRLAEIHDYASGPIQGNWIESEVIRIAQIQLSKIK